MYIKFIIESKIDIVLLFLIFFVGVIFEVFIIIFFGFINNFGLILIILFLFGNIVIFNKGIIIKSLIIIKIFIGENKVWFVGIVFVIIFVVCFVNFFFLFVSCNGIEFDNLLCYIKNFV